MKELKMGETINVRIEKNFFLKTKHVFCSYRSVANSNQKCSRANSTTYKNHIIASGRFSLIETAE